jgi:hypothetical protein
MALSTISGVGAGSSGTILTTTNPKTGNVIQVVNGTILPTQLSVGSGGALVTTGISASITPSSSTSKILVMSNVTNIYSGGGIGMGLAVYRGATQIYIHGYGQSPGYVGSLYSGTGGVLSFVSFPYLDSPSTTSSTTYSLYWGSYNGTAYINYQGSSTVAGTGSYIVLMEIAG